MRVAPRLSDPAIPLQGLPPTGSTSKAAAPAPTFGTLPANLSLTDARVRRSVSQRAPSSRPLTPLASPSSPSPTERDGARNLPRKSKSFRLFGRALFKARPSKWSASVPNLGDDDQFYACAPPHLSSPRSPSTQLNSTQPSPPPPPLTPSDGMTVDRHWPDV